MKKLLIALFILTSCSKQDSTSTKQVLPPTNTATIIKTVSGWSIAQCYYRRLTIAYSVDTTTTKSIEIVAGYGFNDIQVDYIEPLKTIDTINKYHHCAGQSTIYYTLILKNKDGEKEVLGTYKTDY